MARDQIQYYGMATWNGFRQEKAARDAMQLAQLVEIAKEIGGEKHHFRFVQLPFNLAMTEALTLGNQSVGAELKTIMEAAEEMGIHLIASASLLQGQVAQNLPAIRGRGAGIGERCGTRVAICAIGAGNHDRAGGDVAYGARGGEHAIGGGTTGRTGAIQQTFFAWWRGLKLFQFRVAFHEPGGNGLIQLIELAGEKVIRVLHKERLVSPGI